MALFVCQQVRILWRKGFAVVHLCEFLGDRIICFIPDFAYGHFLSVLCHYHVSYLCPLVVRQYVVVLYGD